MNTISLQSTSLRRLLGSITVATAATLLLSTCTPQDQTVPDRAFATMDLLIDLQDLPSGWQSFSPRKPVDHLSTSDSAFIGFRADTDAVRQSASHRVYRYDSSTQAKLVFEELVVRGYGEVPLEWEYESPVADQYDFSCYDYEGREPPNCQWSGRYEEYLVVVNSWLIVDRMSLQDMERVIRAIDARMEQYIKSPEGVEE